MPSCLPKVRARLTARSFDMARRRQPKDTLPGLQGVKPISLLKNHLLIPFNRVFLIAVALFAFIL